jgi:ribosomal protein S1
VRPLQYNPSMRTLRLSTFALVAVLSIRAGTARRDEVTLKNGDRLTGNIVKMCEGNLVIKTPYAGEVKIDWKEVQNITSKIQTLDGSVLQGILTSPSPDHIMVTLHQG